jgi:hypothetical protein
MLPDSYKARALLNAAYGVGPFLEQLKPVTTIIPVSHPDQIQWIGPEIEDYNRVAGLISDAA